MMAKRDIFQQSLDCLFELISIQSMGYHFYLIQLSFNSEYILVDFIQNIIMFTSETSGSHTDYILQQCHERQFELQLQGHQQCEKLKRRIIAAGKAAIIEEFRKKQREAILQRQIYMNVLNNKHKLQRLKARYTLCQQIYREVQIRLKRFANEEASADQYQVFLLASIVQGLIRMYEEAVDIRCLDKDRKLIEQLLPEIRGLYNNFMMNNIGFEHPLQIRVAPNFTLQQRNPQSGPLNKNRQDLLSIGGVILADKTGNITYKATLDSRLNILKQICLPMIREVIWNNKQAEEKMAENEQVN